MAVLRIADVRLDEQLLVVRQGMGSKDRTVPWRRTWSRCWPTAVRTFCARQPSAGTMVTNSCSAGSSANACCRRSPRTSGRSASRPGRTICAHVRHRGGPGRERQPCPRRAAHGARVDLDDTALRRMDTSRRRLRQPAPPPFRLTKVRRAEPEPPAPFMGRAVARLRAAGGQRPVESDAEGDPGLRPTAATLPFPVPAEFKQSPRTRLLAYGPHPRTA